LKLRYRQTTINLPDMTRPSRCACCSRTHTQKGKPLQIQLHHFRYVYPTKTVKQFPMLALENTVPLCFKCHRVADAVRVVATNFWDVVVKLAEMKEKGES
jgi:hypothetical protein